MQTSIMIAYRKGNLIFSISTESKTGANGLVEKLIAFNEATQTNFCVVQIWDELAREIRSFFLGNIWHTPKQLNFYYTLSLRLYILVCRKIETVIILKTMVCFFPLLIWFCSSHSFFLQGHVKVKIPDIKSLKCFCSNSVQSVFFHVVSLLASDTPIKISHRAFPITFSLTLTEW